MRTILVDLRIRHNTIEVSAISSQNDKESPRIHGLGEDARVFYVSYMLSEAGKSLSTQSPAQLDRKRLTMMAVLEYDGQIEKVEEEFKWLLRTTIVATVLAQRDRKIEFKLIYCNLTGCLMLTSTLNICDMLQLSPAFNGRCTTTSTLPPRLRSPLPQQISQSTGKDWKDTVLTLSTANSQALESLSLPKIILVASPSPRKRRRAR
ncbi:hypothetical protein C8Q74DRAFT_1256770 [Fomes fomentarius]|nr:hypothetical protein C8Q74DRAFT_1256770 [Fomes fomentarius]